MPDDGRNSIQAKPSRTSTASAPRARPRKPGRDFAKPGVVADRLAGLHHRAGQRGFGDEHAGPYRVLQLVLVHRAIGVAQQVHQQIEHARLHGDRPPLTPHLPARRVHGAVAEPPGRAGRAFHAGQGDT